MLSINEQRFYLNAIKYSQLKKTLPLILNNVKGNFIDIGCGDLFYKKFIDTIVDNYDSIDSDTRSSSIKYHSDIQNMNVIKDATYDSAICLEVLEHIPNTDKTLMEINRILKNNSAIIFSVPHLSRIHEAPYDFYRFTEYGIKELLTRNGFEIITLVKRGGIFTFLSHQLSTFLIHFAFKKKLIKKIVILLNKWCIVLPSYYLDEIFDKNKRFAIGYSVLAKKI